MNPYVFIVGCARSGTTLLRRMVDAHPDIAITHETHWIPKWYERREGLTQEGFVTPELISSLLAYEKFARMQISRPDLEKLIDRDRSTSYSSFVTGVFDLYGRAQGKRLVGDKTPTYVRRLPMLHALWPHAKFVHLIRDGRNVALSAVNWKRSFEAQRFTAWSEDPLTTIAVWWDWRVRLGREAGSSLEPELYHEIRYESLVSRPEETCTALCTFLGLPYDDAMLRFHEGREKTDPGLDAKKAWRPITSGLRDWRSQMSLKDIERFEAAAGDLLDELGYPRAFPRPSEEKLRNAARIRESFVQDVLARGERLPERWQT